MPTCIELTLSFKAAVNLKKSICCIKYIQLFGEEAQYAFPKEFRSVKNHVALSELPVVKSVVKSFTRKGQIRKINIALSDELHTIYLDEEDNFRFQNMYLELVIVMEASSGYSSPATNNIPEKKRTSSSIIKDMIVEEFNGKNQNVNSCLIIFEKEYSRMDIETMKYPEVLHVFLEGPERRMEIKFNTFGDRGWNDVMYTYTFRYVSGSLDTSNKTCTKFKQCNRSFFDNEYENSLRNDLDKLTFSAVCGRVMHTIRNECNEELFR
ncbi:hypothetical protein PGB90_000345 [Kerria lacca]